MLEIPLTFSGTAAATSAQGATALALGATALAHGATNSTETTGQVAVLEQEFLHGVSLHGNNF